MTRAIQFYEELSFNAWPSLQTLHYDGWILRLANGYTRRANSVSPIYASSIPVEEKVAYCERVYTACNQDTVFKLTTHCFPSDVDAFLDANGYTEIARTSVRTLDLAQLAAPTHTTITMSSDVKDEWLETLCDLNNVNPQQIPNMHLLLENIIPMRCFLTLYRDDVPVSVGLAVLDGDQVGLYDIVTGADFRNQGLGKQLLLNLLHWGKVNGARMAHLGVMVNNSPAVHLYHGLGFREIYQYWYRVKSTQ